MLTIISGLLVDDPDRSLNSLVDTPNQILYQTILRPAVPCWPRAIPARIRGHLFRFRMAGFDKRPTGDRHRGNIPVRDEISDRSKENAYAIRRAGLPAAICRSVLLHWHGKHQLNVLYE